MIQIYGTNFFFCWHNSQIYFDYFASFRAVSCVAATIQTICFADVNKQSSVAVRLPLSWILIFFFFFILLFFLVLHPAEHIVNLCEIINKLLNHPDQPP